VAVVTCSNNNLGAPTVSTGTPTFTAQSVNPLNYYWATNAACASGYFFTTPATCTGCGTGCAACSSATVCTEAVGACNPGYVVNATATPIACVACTAANCLLCDNEDASWSATMSTTLCAVCNPGFILSPTTKTCVACPVNCSNSTYDGSFALKTASYIWSYAPAGVQASNSWAGWKTSGSSYYCGAPSS